MRGRGPPHPLFRRRGGGWGLGWLRGVLGALGPLGSGRGLFGARGEGTRQREAGKVDEPSPRPSPVGDGRGRRATVELDDSLHQRRR